MKVNVMTVPSPDANTENALTLIQVDELYTIMVKGFGQGDYRWKIVGPEDDASLYQLMHEEYLSVESPDTEGFYSGEILGKALIWAEPITFAHVVMDLINNQ
jgi:hypothetical protein